MEGNTGKAFTQRGINLPSQIFCKFSHKYVRKKTDLEDGRKLKNMSFEKITRYLCLIQLNQ